MNYTTTGAKKSTQIPQRHRDLGVEKFERARAFKGAAEEDAALAHYEHRAEPAGPSRRTLDEGQYDVDGTVRP